MGVAMQDNKKLPILVSNAKEPSLYLFKGHSILDVVKMIVS